MVTNGCCHKELAMKRSVVNLVSAIYKSEVRKMKRAISSDGKCFDMTVCGFTGGKAARDFMKRLCALMYRGAGVAAVFFLFVIFGAWSSVPSWAVEVLRLESLTPGELYVEWMASDSTPPPFFRYQVNWGPADGPFPSAYGSTGNSYSTDTSVTLKGLEPGVEYQVRVREGFGWSFGERAVRRVDDYGSDGGTEGVLEVGESVGGWIGSGGDVDWFVVSLEAGRSYYLRLDGNEGFAGRLIGLYDEHGEDVEGGVEWSGMGALVFTPEAGGVYHVSVGGVDERTGSYAVLVADEAPEGVIKGLVIASGGVGELGVSWDEPGREPVDYGLSWAELGEGYGLEGEVYVSGRSYVIEGLDPAEIYKVRARAHYGGEVDKDSLSSGLWAEAVSIQKTVSGLSFKNEEPGELGVSWDEPGREPVDYGLSWAELGKGYGLDGEVYVSGRSYVIEGLDLGEIYRVRVRARYGGDEAGDPWSMPWGEGFARVTAEVSREVGRSSESRLVSQTRGRRSEVERPSSLSLTSSVTIQADSEEENLQVANQQVANQQGESYACSSSCRNSPVCTPGSGNTCRTVFSATMQEQEDKINRYVATLEGEFYKLGASSPVRLDLGLNCTSLRSGNAYCSCSSCGSYYFFTVLSDGKYIVTSSRTKGGPPMLRMIGMYVDDLNHAVSIKNEMLSSGGERCDGGDPAPNTCARLGESGYRTWLGESACGCSYVDWLNEINGRLRGE